MRSVRKSGITALVVECHITASRTCIRFGWHADCDRRPTFKRCLDRARPHVRWPSLVTFAALARCGSISAMAHVRIPLFQTMRRYVLQGVASQAIARRPLGPSSQCDPSYGIFPWSSGQALRSRGAAPEPARQSHPRVAIASVPIPSALIGVAVRLPAVVVRILSDRFGRNSCRHGLPEARSGSPDLIHRDKMSSRPRSFLPTASCCQNDSPMPSVLVGIEGGVVDDRSMDYRFVAGVAF